MKLIAIQPISEWLPTGAKFEIPDDDAVSSHALIEAGLAREDIGANPPEPQSIDPAVDQSSEPATTSRRSYRRRDLKAED